MADPEMPDFLPRLGDDTPEERPQRKWEELFYPQRAPEMPEAYRLLLAEFDRLDAYMRRVSPEDIRYDDALRQREAARVKIMALVDVAKRGMGNGMAHEEKDERAAERQAWVDGEIAKREAKAAEVRKKREEEETARDAREGGEAESQTREEREREERLEGIGQEMRRLRERRVVPFKPVEREGKTGNREDRDEPKAKPVIIDLISDHDLYAKHFGDLEWLVKDMLVAGTLTILAGKPKIGKSFLALQIARAVATTAGLWGNATLGVPVLYLGLEDSQRRLKFRMIGQMGAGVRPSGGLTFATRWPRIGKEGEDGIAAMEEVIRELKCELIVIDTYALFRSRGGVARRGGTAYTQDYDDLEPLVSFCKETGVAVLLIHHTKKGESQDVFDLMSGSVGLQGAADTMMVLDRKRDGESLEATLHCSARDFDGWSWTLEFEPVPCLWKFVGKARVVKTTREQDEVLKAIFDLGGTCTPASLAGVLVGRTRNACKLLLPRLVEAGLLRKISVGVYGLLEPE